MTSGSPSRVLTKMSSPLSPEMCFALIPSRPGPLTEANDAALAAFRPTVRSVAMWPFTGGW